MSRTISKWSAVVLTLFLGLATAALADTSKIQGMIKARNGETMTLQIPGSSDVTVVLSENTTEVSQIQGVFQARRKEMAMASLIPGLEVQVEGTYNDQKQLLAKSVKFKGNDLERARAINAGMHETQVQTQKSQEELKDKRQNYKNKIPNCKSTKLRLMRLSRALDNWTTTTSWMRLPSILRTARLTWTLSMSPRCWRWRRRLKASMAT